MRFTKPPLSIEEKITLLQGRGLLIPDIEKAKKYLNHIGYFRLTGYFKRYQDTTTNQFRKWTTFDQVLDLYIFDRKLRLLTLDAIEKIEVSVKSQIDNIMSTKYGCFWYMEKELFSLDTKTEENDYENFLSKTIEIKEKSILTFIQAYNHKYKEEKILPARMMLESCTLWGISLLFRLLKTNDAKDITQVYNTYYVDLRKRLQLIVNARNISAHHERLRNRKFITKPRVNDVIFKWKYILQKESEKIEVDPNFFNLTLIIHYLLNSISHNNDRLDRLERLFNKHPDISLESMGFDKGRKQKINS